VISTEGQPRPVVAVLDYGIGNLHSAQKGFAAVGADARLTADREEIAAADGVVLPGVGAFGPCMKALKVHGLDEVAKERIDAGVPFFGICIGMQLLFAGSEESPDVPGLGVFPEQVRALPDTVKRPQMQWNYLTAHHDHPMLGGLTAQPWMYFVHGFAAESSSQLVASCDYGTEVVAAVARDNLWACQFHPEKSGAAGLQVLANFVERLRLR